MNRVKWLKKITPVTAAIAICMTAVLLTACGNDTAAREPDSESVINGEMAALSQTIESSGQDTTVKEEMELGRQKKGQIYLYGEMHGEEAIIIKEFELWKDYYEEDGLRHLFLESPYYTAEYLNLWMKADDDQILDEVYEDWEGSAAHNPYLKEFYHKIKEECPETVFHGTDVGHQFGTTGKRYLNYLMENQLETSDQYHLALNAVEQGKYYYENDDDVYREQKMVENFIREFDALEGESVMGIYGGAHVGTQSLDFSTKTIPCMANQLYQIYGDALSSEDLTWIKKDIEPVRMDKIEVAGKEYDAAYFGKEDLTGFRDFSYREFWRLENAYEDFKDRPKSGDMLPYNNYPMLIEEGQVFILEFGKTDGSVIRFYYRSDGNLWEDQKSTEEFLLD